MVSCGGLFRTDPGGKRVRYGKLPPCRAVSFASAVVSLLGCLCRLPFVNVGNSKLVVKVISAGERDLGLLRFIEDRAVNHLPNCACERDDMWFHRILLGKQESSIRDTVFIAVAQN